MPRTLTWTALGALVALAFGFTFADEVTLDRARALYAEGRLRECIDVYRRVAELTERDDPETAGTARNNACVILMNTGALEEALPECEAAVLLRKKTDDEPRLGRAYNNLGLALQYLGRYEESEVNFEQALAINRSRGDDSGETINWANLGVLATQAGWYSKAIDYQRNALELAREHVDAPWALEQIRLARVNQAVVLERLGAYREALSLYDEVLQQTADPLSPHHASIMVNRGVVLRNLGDPIRAIDAFESARATFEKSGDRASLSNVMLNLGLVYHLNLDDPIRAEAAFGEALRLARETGDRSEEIQDLYYMGRMLLAGGRVDEAETLFLRCLDESRESASSEGTWASLEGLSRIARSRGHSVQALKAALEAIDEIEKVRGSLTDRSLRRGYFGNKRGVYELTVEILADLEATQPGAGHAEKAFEIVHRAKARALLDALGESSFRSVDVDTPAVLEQIAHDTLLEYFAGETHLYAWLARDGRLEMQVLGELEPILVKVGQVYRALSHGSEPAPQTVRELSGELLGVFAETLRNTDHLRVAPDGRLHYLPFELLIRPGSTDRRLVEEVTVSYLPNGAALARKQRPRSPAARPWIGFGDPLIPGDVGDSPTPASVLVNRFKLQPLAAAADELAALDQWLGGPVVIRTGGDATEEGFRELTAQGARVVHLVSHTIVDERAGRGAAILLTAGPTSDGLLYPQEIAELNYPVDLTVLAACRTALGPDGAGDGLATLTGSFLAAGSSAVVATLWDVGDSATRVFMEQFYYQLGRGHSPATALRKAKRRMLSNPEWNDSSVWSAYILVGQSGPVTSGLPVRSWVLAGVALLVGLLVWRYRATRN